VAIVDYFGRDHLRELFEIEDGYAVSIYMPTHRRGADVAAQSLRLRAALKEARDLIGADGAADGRRVLEAFEPLVADNEFWRHQADGLALFACRGFERLYRLPVQVPELVVVGPTFHTKPLIEFLQAPDRFWVLALTQKEVRLWEGSTTGLAPVNLATVPTSLQEVLGTPIEKDQLSVRSPRGPNSTAYFHGHGAGKDDSKQELEKYFRHVDYGVNALLEDEIGPIVLAAVDYYHPIYQGISKLENLAADGIVGNVTDWDEARIHASAWPIARKVVDRKIDKALNLWETSYGRGKVESDVSAAGRLAVAGRVRLLLAEKSRRVWGRLDRVTGAVEVIRENGKDPGNEIVDLLDELAEITIKYGGRALVLPPERMPTGTGLAAVLR
jgi:hypothetical protein